MCVTSIRTMSVLLFLPLLLAQRHPISLRSRSSILRRMPIFYGKRDPSMAAPSVPSASLSELPGPSLQHPGASSPGRVYLDSDLVLYSLGLPAMPGPGDEDREVKTATQRPANDKRSGGDAGGRPPWTVPSVLLTKLHDYINNDDSFANGREEQARPQFSRPQAWQQSEQPIAGYGRDDPVHKNRTGLLGQGPSDPTERLRGRLELLSEVLNYNKDHDHEENLQRGDENQLGMIPLGLSKTGGTKNYEDYEDMLGNSMTAEAGDDVSDYGNSYDDDSITRFMDSGTDENPWWGE